MCSDASDPRTRVFPPQQQHTGQPTYPGQTATQAQPNPAAAMYSYQPQQAHATAAQGYNYAAYNYSGYYGQPATTQMQAAPQQPQTGQTNQTK